MKACLSRRHFLETTAAAGAASVFGPAGRLFAAQGPALHEPGRRKVIVVQFGGGLRCSESIDPEGRELIPRLWNEMVPEGALFTNMRVEHRVVHPNSTGSMMTGHWEWDDIDWSRPVSHPTIFEIYRRARRAPDTSAWAFVYASILAKTGESLAGGYGPSFGANIVEPPTIPRASSAEMDRLMSNAAAEGTELAGREAAAACAELARTSSRISLSGLRSRVANRFVSEEYEAWKSGKGTTSHDAFLTDGALSCMRVFAPDVMAIDYGEIDCAHYGSWSRYVEAIRRTDELTARVLRAVRELPAYRGNTLMLILPDHGRELDGNGRWGFVHHSDFYTDRGADEGCRRVWMLAIGPGLQAGVKIDRAVPITTVAATALEFLGLDASRGAAESVLGLCGS